MSLFEVVKRRWWVIPLGLVVVAIAFGLITMANRPEDVLAYQVSRQDVVASLTVTGEVRARTTIQVSPPVSAKIAHLFVDDGDVLTKNQRIAELDLQDVPASVSEAESRLAAAQASYQFVRQGTRSEDIARLQARVSETQSGIQQSQAQVGAAQSKLGQTQRDVDRYNKLFHDGLVSAQEFDSVKTQRDLAKQDVDRLNANLTSQRSVLKQASEEYRKGVRGPTAAEVREAEANRNAAANLVKAAKAHLSDRFINSTIDGIVLKREQVAGDLATPGKAIVRIADWKTIEIACLVEEADLPRVRLNQEAYVILDAQPETPWNGTVTRIGSEVNPDNGTVEVIVKLTPNQKVRLLPGMTADVNIVTARLKQAVVVPATAVRKDNGQSIVYVFDGRKLKQQPVKATRVSLDYFEIQDGLSPDEWVARFANVQLLEKRNVAPLKTTLNSKKPVE